MGRLSFLLFCIFTIAIAAPPLTLEAPPPGFSSSSDENTGLNLTQQAAYDVLLNFFPSSSPIKLPLSPVANSSNKLYPPDPYSQHTVVGDIVQFRVYASSRYLLDLSTVVELARRDAIQHLHRRLPGPMPRELKYRHGRAFFDLEVEPYLTWERWAWALHQIGIFQGQTQDISFDFVVATVAFRVQLGRGQVRSYV